MCFPGFASLEGLVQSFPVSGGSVVELSVTDLSRGATVGDGTGPVC